MKNHRILTAESVTEGHPDKLCDLIADSVLDECLRNDRYARVACEVMATAGKITVAGEITANVIPDIPHIVCSTVRSIGYGCDYEVEVITHDQSPDIHHECGFRSRPSEMRGSYSTFHGQFPPKSTVVPTLNNKAFRGGGLESIKRKTTWESQRLALF